MRDGRRVIDTDTHQMEPPGMWAQYIDASFKARAPAMPQGAENQHEIHGLH